MRILGIDSLLRLRFSLRTLLISVTILSIAGYFWFIAPTQVARRFAATINTENFEAADEFFLDDNDRFLVEMADRRWAFKSRCSLQPLSIGQLLTGRRNVTLQLSYFEFDQNASQTVRIAAAPFGLKRPTASQTTYSGTFIDAIRETQRR
jgi:hypothetical protein